MGYSSPGRVGLSRHFPDRRPRGWRGSPDDSHSTLASRGLTMVSARMMRPMPRRQATWWLGTRFRKPRRPVGREKGFPDRAVLRREAGWVLSRTIYTGRAAAVNESVVTSGGRPCRVRLKPPTWNHQDRLPPPLMDVVGRSRGSGRGKTGWDKQRERQRGRRKRKGWFGKDESEGARAQVSSRDTK